jgi:hypothetical protein
MSRIFRSAAIIRVNGREEKGAISFVCLSLHLGEGLASRGCAVKSSSEYPGAIYHVMNGYRREDIFRDDVDQQDFLKTLAEACEKTGWQAHVYCLMRNHFHLVMKTSEANLVVGMRSLLSRVRTAGDSVMSRRCRQ